MCGECFDTNEDMETHIWTEHKTKTKKESLLKKQNELFEDNPTESYPI